MSSNILVFAERREGAIRRPALEAVSTARRLAQGSGGNVDVLALGPGAAACGDALAKYGANRLFAVEAEHAELYAPELYAAALAEACTKSEAFAVLVPATAMGRDLAPRTAARLRSACATDLVEIEIGDGGALKGKRPVYSGKAFARVAVPQARPWVASLRPNVFPADEVDEARTVEVVALEAPLSAAKLGVRAVRVDKPEQQELDVAEASVIVAGGRGLKEAKNFSLVRELAQALGGAVGASRAVVDAEWIAHAHQVGQTGKVVSPNLYVACGISGAVQHLAGMSSSKIIVAINKDPDAPIFSVADYGIVGDLFEVVPALTEAVRSLRGE
jgi:electron transfer flavoprotein alpha subunit